MAKDCKEKRDFREKKVAALAFQKNISQHITRNPQLFSFNYLVFKVFSVSLQSLKNWG